MIGETETMKKMPDGEEKQGRRAVVKDISGCVAVASFAATSSQKQVIVRPSRRNRTWPPFIVIVFEHFFVSIMVRASIRDNQRRPRRRLGGGDTVGTDNRRRSQTLRMRGAGRASGPVALPGGIMTVCANTSTITCLIVCLV